MMGIATTSGLLRIAIACSIALTWTFSPSVHAEPNESLQTQTSSAEQTNSASRSDSTFPSTTAPSASYADEPFRLEQLLPASLVQSTDINLWGWGSYLHDSNDDESSYWIGDISFGITHRFGDRVAATADIHYIYDNGESRGFLEQAFVTANLIPQSDTLLTVGKFNASFGVEPRNEWDRLTGTTSLLFGAQPQDLVGAMITQPLGKTGITVRPFITTQFEGKAELYGPPSAGVLVEARPNDTLRLAVTNWIGPGLIPPPENHLSGYAADDYLLENWVGTRLYRVRSGMLYFADANVRWNPRPDLTLAAEALIASNGGSADRLAWSGFLVLANYDITDRWRVFGRWSYLNDNQWMLTGAEHTRQEVSVGAAYEVIRGVDVRGEYRHDFDSSGDLDSISVHVNLSL